MLKTTASKVIFRLAVLCLLALSVCGRRLRTAGTT